MRRSGHVAHIRLTRAEWQAFTEFAACRNLKLEDMLREALRLQPFDATSDTEPPRPPHLRLVVSRPADEASTRAG